MKEVKIGIGRMGVRFLVEGRKWRLSGLLYAGDLVLYSELEEDLKVMVGHFVEVYRRRGLKVNAGKSKVMVLGWEEGLGCEISVDELQLEQVFEFKYLGCVLNELGTDDAECQLEVASGRKVAGAYRP